MLKRFFAITLGISLAVSTTFTSHASNISFPALRTAQGIYHDYLTIVTDDGEEWLLDDSEDSKYLDENGNAIFHDGEVVLVLFDTEATFYDVTDDVILHVHSREY